MAGNEWASSALRFELLRVLLYILIAVGIFGFVFLLWMDAFQRSADIDAKRITVEANGGEVILKGMVRSWAKLHSAFNRLGTHRGMRGWHGVSN